MSDVSMSSETLKTISQKNRSDKSMLYSCSHILQV